VVRRAVNGVSGWRFVESAVVPDEAVLEFSCNWTSAVDVLVVAVQKATKEVWWFVNSCSPPRSGGEHVVLQQKIEVEMFKQRNCLRSRDIQEVLYRSYDGSVADMTEQSEVTVETGAEGNGGNFAFEPAAIRIDTGTTVVWKWTGQGAHITS
jgi:plastocyanin